MRRGNGRGERAEEREGFVQYILYTFIDFHIPLDTFIYLHIPPNIFEYLYKPLKTPMYFKISNIRKIKADIRHTQMAITQSPEHPQRSEFDSKVPTMSPEALAHPTRPNFK